MSVDAAHPVDGDLLDEELLLDENVVVDGGGGSLVAFAGGGGALLHTRDSTAAAPATRMPTVPFTRMRLQEIWRHPVKSIGDERLSEAEVTGTGISGDRGWGAFDVTKRVTRCVMVSRPQPGLDRDLDALRTVNRERDGALSIALMPRAGGRIAVGDAVTTKRGQRSSACG